MHSGWNGFINRGIRGWETIATTWIRGLKRGGVVYYERLRKNTAKELVRLAAMIGFGSVNRERLDCVLQHNKDNSFRRTDRKYPE